MNKGKKMGSVFFTDSEFLKKLLYIPEQYELPLYLHKTFYIQSRSRKWCDYLEKKMLRYKNLYKQIFLKQKKIMSQYVPKPECKETGYITERNPTPKKSWSLAPNRYNIKDGNLSEIIYKQTGTKGPFACFTGDRNDSTLRGHFKPKKFIGPFVNDFYKLPKEMEKLNHPRKYFVYKLRKMKENQKPSLRFMLADLTLCYRDPNEPGPGHYFFETEKETPSTKILNNMAKKEVLEFYPYTTVKVTTRNNYNEPYLRPGPDRYNLDEQICRCRKNKIIKSISRRSTKPILKTPQKSMVCKCCKNRNIPGNGHVHVFLAKLLSEKIQSTKKYEKNIPIYDNLFYLQMIKDPLRKEFFSYSEYNDTYRRQEIHFNTTERPKKRCKLRVNKRICFMSSKPRFKDIEISSFVVPFADVHSRMAAAEKHERKEQFKEKDTDKYPLSAFPYHLVPPRAKRPYKVVCFQQLPKPKVIKTLGLSSQHEFSDIYKPYKLEDFFREEPVVGDTALDTSTENMI